MAWGRLVLVLGIEGSWLGIYACKSLNPEGVEYIDKQEEPTAQRTMVSCLNRFGPHYCPDCVMMQGSLGGSFNLPVLRKLRR